MKACVGALALQLQEKVGYPWTTINADMYRWGSAGIASWGTVCGTLNGIAAVVNLVVPFSDMPKVLDEVFGWYTETALPLDKHQAWQKYPTAQSVAGNPLCHTSVSKWCAASGYREDSPERKERCGKLSGDTAAKTVEVLNAYFDGKFAQTYKIPASMESCYNCHVSRMSNTLTKMDCTPCHPNAHKK
ncbi:MAG: C_GCAxxG_C_C family protein [Firmicutes bacterium]|nr:C_GCAxxG_C_C family protein [Bacillota bacterium]